MQSPEIQPERERFRPEDIEGGRSVEVGSERPVVEVESQEIGDQRGAEQVVDRVREELASGQVDEVAAVHPRVQVRSNVIESIRGVLSTAMSQGRKIDKLVELFQVYGGSPEKKQELVNVVSFESTKSVTQQGRKSGSSGNSLAA